MFAALLYVTPAAGVKWGTDGHQISALVAQHFLTASASAKAKELLPESDGQLAPVASWADTVKRSYQYNWTGPLHFINTPSVCNYDRKRDCHSGNNSMWCVDGAIQNYSTILKTHTAPKQELTDAIKFLIHYVGDIHQPLHVSFEKDQGGNLIKGKFYNKSDNLHSIWDSDILLKRRKDFGDTDAGFATYLISKIAGDWSAESKSWIACSEANQICSDVWAKESIVYACDYAYSDVDGKTRLVDGFVLQDPYYKRVIPLIEKQLAKAGMRLAASLNVIYK